MTALIWPLWDLLSFRCLGIPGSSLGFLGSLTFTRPSSALDSSQGHEDVDQVIGEAAGEVAQHEYDTPEQLVQILDGLGKSARAPKRAKSGRNREIFGEKMDQSACWKVWVERLGIHLKGLRTFDSPQFNIEFVVELWLWFGHLILNVFLDFSLR